MRISLLLHRERFGEILEATLGPFLTIFSGQAQTVHWCTKSSVGGREGQQWQCDPYLNGIFTRDVCPRSLRPVVNEFGRSTVWWRRPPQYAYVKLATHPATSPWLTPYRMIVSPGLERAREMLILGGNHHLRLLDATRGRAYVIQKSNAPGKFVENEIALRQRECVQGLPIPALCEIGPDLVWYSEEYVEGTAINRLPCRDRAHWAFSEAVRFLAMLSSRTTQEQGLEAYVDRLNGEITVSLSQASVLTDPERRTMTACVTRLCEIVARCVNAVGGCLDVSQTHGDFQPGNVLCDSGRIWLIDWEFTGERQAGYDALVHHLGTRAPIGLAQRIAKSLHQWDIKHPAIRAWLGEAWLSRGRRRVLLSVFLLEELALQLQQNRGTMLTCTGEGLSQFLVEAKEAIEFLHE